MQENLVKKIPDRQFCGANLGSSYNTTSWASLPPHTTPGTECLHTNATQCTTRTLPQQMFAQKLPLRFVNKVG